MDIVKRCVHCDNWADGIHSDATLWIDRRTGKIIDFHMHIRIYK